jgi:hypothetical protein
MYEHRLAQAQESQGAEAGSRDAESKIILPN